MSPLIFGRKRELWLEVRPRDDIRADAEPAAEHATLASWRMGLGGQLLTVGHTLEGAETFEEVEDVPLIDLAAWLADSWSALMFGPALPPGVRHSPDGVLAQDVADGFETLPAQKQERLRQWAMTRSLTWAASDYAVPDVLFSRCDAGIEVSWRPQEPAADWLFDVVFAPPAAAGIVGVAAFTELVAELCDWVLTRCRQDKVHDVRLGRIERWQERDRANAAALAADWLEGLLAGAGEWLQKIAPNVLQDLARYGDSASPEFAFLRTASGLRDSGELDLVWNRLRAEVGVAPCAAALHELRRGVTAELDPRKPWNSGYTLARQVRKRLQAILGMSEARNSPLDPAELLGHLGLRVVETTDLPVAIQGAALLDERGRGAVLVNLASTLGASRSGGRAILAHELCHLLVDRTPSGALAQMDLRRDLVRDRRLEQRANAFAAEILLPRHEILQRCVRGRILRSELLSLAKEFGAGIDLAEYQAANARIAVQ